jgi:sialic acid synthase SpsE
MQIGNFDLEDKVLVVAEIGNNHEGNFEIAKELVRQAAECGVAAVKFQTFNTEHFTSRSDAARFERLKSFELSHEQFAELAELARSHGLLFISTPLDLGSAAFLENIVDAFKIASGDNDYYPLLADVARRNKPLIISTGASDLQQVSRTVAFVKDQWAQTRMQGQLALLHCVSSYPVPAEQANLLAIPFLAENFDCTIGYSDHTLGINAALLALGLGARLIEKHFTLDKHYSDFRDHQLSADPPEMRTLVEAAAQASLMLGKSEKKIQPCEEASRAAIRRSIVAGADLPAGRRVVFSDLTWIRPAGGLAPGNEDQLIGKVLKRAVRFGDQLRTSDVE